MSKEPFPKRHKSSNSPVAKRANGKPLHHIPQATHYNGTRFHNAKGVHNNRQLIIPHIKTLTVDDLYHLLKNKSYQIKDERYTDRTSIYDVIFDGYYDENGEEIERRLGTTEDTKKIRLHFSHPDCGNGSYREKPIFHKWTLHELIDGVKEIGEPSGIGYSGPVIFIHRINPASMCGSTGKRIAKHIGEYLGNRPNMRGGKTKRRKFMKRKTMKRKI